MDRRFFLNVIGAVASAPLAMLKYSPAGGGVIEQPVTEIVPVRAMPDPSAIDGLMASGVNVTLRGLGGVPFRFDGFVTAVSLDMPARAVLDVSELSDEYQAFKPLDMMDPGSLTMTIKMTSRVECGI